MASMVEEGLLRFDSADLLSESDLNLEVDWLCRFETTYRLQLPGPPPPVVPEAVRWATSTFLRSAQFVAFRQLGEELLRAELSHSCPVRRDSSTDYSVDLVFRFLPDLFRIARAASESDPLLDILQRWTVEWPLSTVGMPFDHAAALTTQFVMGDETLRKLYADRIIARQDRRRVKDAAVRTAVREWIGYYPDYAGGLRDVLQATP